MNHQAVLDAWAEFHALVKATHGTTDHPEAVAFLEAMDAHAAESIAVMTARKAEHDADHAAAAAQTTES